MSELPSNIRTMDRGVVKHFSIPCRDRDIKRAINKSKSSKKEKKKRFSQRKTKSERKTGTQRKKE